MAETIVEANAAKTIPQEKHESSEGNDLTEDFEGVPTAHEAATSHRDKMVATALGGVTFGAVIARLSGHTLLTPDPYNLLIPIALGAIGFYIGSKPGSSTSRKGSRSTSVSGNASRPTLLIQRLCDILCAASLLLLLMPVYLLIAVAIKADSAGPVLFTQRRVGKDGIEFPFFKFRSMVADAESRRHLLERDFQRSGPVFMMRNDPRVTPVGRLLRKWSLDELPQLFNVLRGDMSLVGPRPALPREVALYTPRQRQRLLVTPGLTGLWQVSGRASLSFDHSIELDLLYIQNQSLSLNLLILLKTLPALLKGDGAY